ncbi:S8 family serine peptidase [uncultured Dokdonia sp.]|uniref:S8 family peptidase n=1 Tax=uncultured Dokdonia sp. TaxID=575653 RepID=UPI00262EB396|nr:S8 family serine peptidase [uncultured Dokdonia sp.]
MKKIIGSFLIVTCLFVASCSDIDDITRENSVTEANYTTQSTFRNTPKFSKRELIIQYKKHTPPNRKAALRSYYGAVEYEVCAHCDGTLEKWDFGPGADLENKLGSVRSGSGGAESIQNVITEFNFKFEQEVATLNGGSGNSYDSDKIVSPDNEGVIIAVLDSGIDTNYPTLEESAPFLYNASNLGIPGVYSGWDYVNGDNNCYDDDTLVHGTAVSSLMHTSLNNVEVPFQLLPVKIANHQGEVSIFNMLCGMLFALPKADILQISAGWYDAAGANPYTTAIFLDVLSEYEDVLVVTSAGNSNLDNDGQIAHYPSNFSALTNNVIAIAATNHEATDASYFTNYGRNTVDFITNGTYIPFVNHMDQPVLISGTSFSAPLVTAVAARILYNSGMTYTPLEIKNQLDYQGIPVNYTKPTKYDKYIPHFYQ